MRMRDRRESAPKTLFLMSYCRSALGCRDSPGQTLVHPPLHDNGAPMSRPDSWQRIQGARSFLLARAESARLNQPTDPVRNCTLGALGSVFWARSGDPCSYVLSRESSQET